MGSSFPEKINSPRFSEELEERLRPCRYLGYDRDRIGVALLRREMLEVAESQFRRAVYLNPFEPRFREHLAWTVFRAGRYTEALTVIDSVIADVPDNRDARIVREKIQAKLGGLQ